MSEDKSDLPLTRVAILGRHPDGSLRDAKVHNLPASDIVTAVLRLREQ